MNYIVKDMWKGKRNEERESRGREGEGEGERKSRSEMWRQKTQAIRIIIKVNEYFFLFFK